MTPLDDAPRSEDHADIDVTDPPARGGSGSSRWPDGVPPAFDDIWSSIGPGRVPGRGEGPPTIRPSDLVEPSLVSPTPITMTAPPLEKDLPVTETNPNLTTPTDPTSTPDALREELRIGVRMLQALDAQFKRAESLIQSEEEAARRVEEAIERLSRRFESIETGSVVAAGVDAGEIERTATAAVERITSAADDAARQLHDRLDRFVALDTRLDELDATLKTVERRLERLSNDPGSTTSTTPTTIPTTTTSGSLSIEPRVTDPTTVRPTGTTLDDSDPELAATIRLQLLVDRGEEVRRELRSDLEAICTASATLVEIVERASETERALRGTLETAASPSTPSVGDGDAGTTNWSVASILRRLADEFDATESTTPRPTTLPSPVAGIARSIAAIAPTTPVELDVSSGTGHPVRREPLVEPAAPTDAITVS
jgi:hypothetical protein